MQTTRQVTTQPVAIGTSRTRRDPHMVRGQFEDWLNSLAADDDTARAERLAELFARSRFKRQKDLAEAVPVEVRTLQRWLEGKPISKPYWDALADALGTSWRYLIFGEQEEPELDATQMDRIEEMLHEISDRLEYAGFTLPTHEEIADREEARTASKPAPRPTKQPGTQRKRRAG